MSLILDALRKSEAERRKAQAAADPLADAPRTPAASLTVVPAWVWPTVAIAALALALWWSMGDSAPPEALATDNTAADTTNAVGTGAGGTPGAMRVRDAVLDPADPDAGSRTGAATSDSMAAASPAQSTGTTAAAPRPIDPTTTAELDTARGQAAESTAPSAALPGATPASDTSVRVPSATAVATPAPTRPASSATDLPSPPREQVVPPPRPGTSAGTGTGAGAPLRLADLSTADRQQLPPLKMSMHMWGAESPRRFAIIDGNRVGEGDRVGDAVVETIDQDGVVLAWNGIRLRVPVR